MGYRNRLFIAARCDAWRALRRRPWRLMAAATALLFVEGFYEFAFLAAFSAGARRWPEPTAALTAGYDAGVALGAFILCLPLAMLVIVVEATILAPYLREQRKRLSQYDANDKADRRCTRDLVGIGVLSRLLSMAATIAGATPGALIALLGRGLSSGPVTLFGGAIAVLGALATWVYVWPAIVMAPRFCVFAAASPLGALRDRWLLTKRKRYLLLASLLSAHASEALGLVGVAACGVGLAVTLPAARALRDCAVTSTFLMLTNDRGQDGPHTCDSAASRRPLPEHRSSLLLLLVLVASFVLTPRIAHAQSATLLTGDAPPLASASSTPLRPATASPLPDPGPGATITGAGSTTDDGSQGLLTNTGLFLEGARKAVVRAVTGTAALVQRVAKLSGDGQELADQQMAIPFTPGTPSEPVIPADDATFLKGVGQGLTAVVHQPIKTVVLTPLRNAWTTLIKGSWEDRGGLAANVALTVSPVVGSLSKLGPVSELGALSEEESELGALGNGVEEVVTAEHLETSGTRIAANEDCLGGYCDGMECFAPGTLVATADGLRPIETLQTGDRVFARDEVTGAEDYERITATFVSVERPVVELQVSSAEGFEAFWVTPQHPFFVEGRGWVPAADLGPSTDVVAEGTGDRVRVTAVASLAHTSSVYNLQVEHFHTYFVGRAHAWVHNDCGKLVDGTTAIAGNGSRYSPFPTSAEVERALGAYLNDPVAARAGNPVPIGEFFATPVASANAHSLQVELLQNGDGQPIAFLRAKFAGGDMYWNDRFKDVQLFKLVQSTGTTLNPFPEAAYVPNEGAALVRLWTKYTPLSKGAPEGLAGEQLDGELARISTWSYVSGNVDGVAANLNNGGFALFQDADGVQRWRGVLIDQGAAWHPPPESALPWNTNLLGRGPVRVENLPPDMIASLQLIARSSASDLARRSGFPPTDGGGLAIVRDIRARAQQVLVHYGFSW